MKVWIVPLLCLLALPVAAQTRWIDSIEVIVNDDVILVSEVEKSLQQQRGAAQAAGQSHLLPPMAQFRQDIVESLVERSVLFQRAKKIGINISDQALNERLASVAAQNKLSLEQFIDQMQASGQDYNFYRQQLREEMMIQQLVSYEVGGRIRVSELQAERVLESENHQQLKQAVSYRLLYRKFADVQSAQQYIQTFEGKDMSSDTEAKDLGFREQEALPSIFKDFVPDMKVGAIAQPVERNGSYHVVQLMQKQGDFKEMVLQHNVRHILIMPNEIRDLQQAKEQAQQLRQQIQAGADFSDLAKIYSDDSVSGARGGGLGWTDGSEMVPQFRQQLKQAELNAVSAVFETEYGFHFLQVTERRQFDVTQQSMKNRVRQGIGDKAYREQFPRWIADLKASAYIRYRQDNKASAQERLNALD